MSVEILWWEKLIDVNLSAYHVQFVSYENLKQSQVNARLV